MPVPMTPPANHNFHSSFWKTGLKIPLKPFASNFSRLSCIWSYIIFVLPENSQIISSLSISSVSRRFSRSARASWSFSGYTNMLTMGSFSKSSILLFISSTNRFLNFVRAGSSFMNLIILSGLKTCSHSTSENFTATSFYRLIKTPCKIKRPIVLGCAGSKIDVSVK